jgi:hypothetical protein
VNALQELIQLLNSTKRKTLPIEQIKPLLKEIDKMYIQTSKRLKEESEMNKALRSINGELAIRLGMKQMPDSQIKRLFQLKKERKAGGINAQQPKQIR